MASEFVLTKKGKIAMEQELEFLKTVKRAEISEQIKVARSFGDLSENAEWLRFVTPFAYTDAADIITDVALDPLLVGLGMAYAVVGLAVAFVVYARKDVRA